MRKNIFSGVMQIHTIPFYIRTVTDLIPGVGLYQAVHAE